MDVEVVTKRMATISTTPQELESGRGHTVTGGGGLVPMSEVIRQAATAHHYLAVFDRHTGEALYLGRSRRLASVAQRIVLYAKIVGVPFRAARRRRITVRRTTRPLTGSTAAKPTSPTSHWTAVRTTAE